MIRTLVALAIVAFASSASAISLEQAVASGAVAAEITAVRSYQSVRISLANHSDHAMRVTALPGMVLENEDADEQDVTLAQP